MTRCICIFEGGGAKGIAHVGALRALEDADFELAGFAGTSAGAIVAALAAGGYTSRDMFDEGGSILDVIDEDRSNVWAGKPFRPLGTPPRLLGTVGWASLRLFGHLSRSMPLALVLIALLSSGIPYWMGFFGPGTMVICQALVVLALAAVPLYVIWPLASLKPMASAINQALSLKVRGNRDPSPVTFSDLRAAGCAPLKIVATDITSRSLILFSADNTPDVCVGDAVAASACIPAIFRAHRVGTRLCYDGGLVSNLPAWSFDAERSIDRDSWTAVVEIGDIPPKGKASLFTRFWEGFADRLLGKQKPRGLDILRATVTTAVFGAAVLNTRNVDRLRNQPLEVDLGLLEFDVSRDKAAAIIASAARESRANIVYQMDDLPRLIEDTCQTMRGQIIGLINIARTSEGLTRFEGRVRIALFFPSRDDPHSLISEFSYGFEDDADERVRLPIASSLIGLVWREKQGYYLNARDPAEWDTYLSRPEDRWVRKLRWNAMSWILAIPYHHVAGDQDIVFAIDADKPLEVDDLALLSSSIFELVETMLDINLPLEAFAWLR